MSGGYRARAARIAQDGRGGATEGRAHLRWSRCSGGRTEAVVAQGVRRLKSRNQEESGVPSTTPLLRLLFVSRRIGAQPQRDVGGLHRLPHHTYEVLA